ncbi:alginate O-acetyltransferase AlgX-related protein [Xanthobacteraceae bacterium A53D]
MALLLSFRRWWCVVFVALLSLPTIGLFTPDLPAPVRMNVAVPAGWWIRAAEKLDPFINDNYGMRGVFMAGHATYGRAMKASRNRPVLIGRNDRMFYTGEQAMDQTLGKVFRKAPIDQFVQVTSRMQELLAKSGARLVVAVPPNGQSVYTEDLPEWAAHEMRRPTEYDHVAKALPEAGVPFVDLRKPLIDAKAGGPVYYRTDTHWNHRGALIGFNAVLGAAGLPGAVIPENDALGPIFERGTGDLSRFLGDVREKGDTDYQSIGPMIRPKGLTPITGVMPPAAPNDPFEPYAFETGHAGPRILVIGDSFSQFFWQGPLAAVSSAYGWMHHRSCKFDWSAIERFKPDIVIYAPVERSLPCQGTPAGLPMPAGKPS